MERLLVRLQSDESGWILKGGFAMELRLRGLARTTKDIDVTAELEVGTSIAASESEILDRLRDAASRSVDDYFEFVVAEGSDVPNEETSALSFRIVPSIADEVFGPFGLDVGSDAPRPGPPDVVQGSGHLLFAGIPVERFRIVSLAHHFADKIHAYSRPREVRSRVKDLVDLLLLDGLGLPPVEMLRRELEVVFASLGTHSVPSRLPEPPQTWEAPFRAEAAVTGLGPMTLEQARAKLERIWESLGF